MNFFLFLPTPISMNLIAAIHHQRKKKQMEKESLMEISVMNRTYKVAEKNQTGIFVLIYDPGIDPKTLHIQEKCTTTKLHF